MHAEVPLRCHDEQKIPRGLLRAIGLMVLLSLFLAGYARLTGATPAATPPQAATQVERAIVIASSSDGSATVTDPDGAVIFERGPGQAGFISGVGRAMTRVRVVAGVPLDAPALLSLHADGSLRLIDPSTGWRVELKAFGRDNEAAFAALLPPPPAAGEAPGGTR